MIAYFDFPIGWAELAKRTTKEFIDDNGLGLAAQLAYYFFFALFPALLFVIALASFFPLENLLPRILSATAAFAPEDVLRIIQEQIQKISQGNHGGLLTPNGK